MQFSTFDIQKKLGINRNTIQQWLDSGFITPSIQRSIGQGTRNRFSLADLYQIELFRRLLDLGLHRRFAAKLTVGINVEEELRKGSRYLVRKETWSSLESKKRYDIDQKRKWNTERLLPRVLSDDEVISYVINLAAIKKTVDERMG